MKLMNHQQIGLQNIYHLNDGILIDEEDLPKVLYRPPYPYQKSKIRKWHTKKCERGTSLYAVSHVKTCHGWTKEYLHRIILNVPEGKCIDHINGNGLDNRKTNLRIVEQKHNCYHCKPKKNVNSKSLYKGVYRRSDDKAWCAQIMINHKTISLGSYNNELDAARAYNKKAKELFGEYAWFNKI